MLVLFCRLLKQSLLLESFATTKLMLANAGIASRAPAVNLMNERLWQIIFSKGRQAEPYKTVRSAIQRLVSLSLL